MSKYYVKLKAHRCQFPYFVISHEFPGVCWVTHILEGFCSVIPWKNHQYHQTSNKAYLSRQENCWSLRCSCSIVYRCCSNNIFILDLTRGVTIRVPHDTIRISIQRSRYNTYLDTYLNTVRCQRDVMSSMKAETPVIRSPAHNLLLQWMEYLLLQLPMLSQDVTLLSYIRVFP